MNVNKLEPALTSTNAALLAQSAQSSPLSRTSSVYENRTSELKKKRKKDVKFLPKVKTVSVCSLCNAPQSTPAHLDDVLRPDEAVPCGEVPVDVVVSLEVGHAAAHLHHDVQQRVHVVQQRRLQPTQVLQQAPVLQINVSFNI